MNRLIVRAVVHCQDGKPNTIQRVKQVDRCIGDDLFYRCILITHDDKMLSALAVNCLIKPYQADLRDSDMRAMWDSVDTLATDPVGILATFIGQGADVETLRSLFDRLGVDLDRLAAQVRKDMNYGKDEC